MKTIAERHKGGHRQWLCVCQCGNEKWCDTVPKSCDCSHKVESPVKKAVPYSRHGKTLSRSHVAWRTMKQRCLNSKSKIYAEYGGRGITICDRWKLFENFYADMGDPPEGMTLQLCPNPDGNYEPGNCKWLPPRRNARYIVAYGMSMTMREWSKITGISYGTLYDRIVSEKMSPELALFKRSKKHESN